MGRACPLLFHAALWGVVTGNLAYIGIKQYRNCTLNLLFVMITIVGFNLRINKYLNLYVEAFTIGSEKFVAWE